MKDTEMHPEMFPSTGKIPSNTKEKSKTKVCNYQIEGIIFTCSVPQGQQQWRRSIMVRGMVNTQRRRSEMAKFRMKMFLVVLGILFRKQAKIIIKFPANPKERIKVYTTINIQQVAGDTLKRQVMFFITEISFFLFNATFCFP